MRLDESRRLIAAAEADDAANKRSLAAPFFALLLGTGLRTGEALALRYGPDGLDLDGGYVRVRASLDRVGTDGEYRLLSPKSRASRRDVPLTPEDVRRLRAHRLATGRPDDGAFVFTSPDGSPLPAQGLPRSTWRRLLGLQPVTKTKRPEAEPRKPKPKVVLVDSQPVLHDLRHSFATHALAAGLSVHAVAKLLGHEDAGLVLRRYGHALPNELATAGETLSAWRADAGG